MGNTFVLPELGQYFLIQGIRQLWDPFFKKHFMGLLHPKYANLQLKDRENKLYVVGRQIYDFIFHTSTTIIMIVLFRKESWFPLWTGGSSTCNDIFANYPRWSATLNPAI